MAGTIVASTLRGYFCNLANSRKQMANAMAKLFNVAGIIVIVSAVNAGLGRHIVFLSLASVQDTLVGATVGELMPHSWSSMLPRLS